MRYFIYILLFCVVAEHSNAQERRMVSILMVDIETQDAILGAHLKFENKINVSNKKGLIKLELPQTAKFEITHISYRDTVVHISSFQNSITISLQAEISNLPTAQVNNKAYEVFSPKTTHVFDYEFVGDTLLALTYQREQMFRKESEQSVDLYLGCKLVVVSPFGSILHTTNLPDYCSGFHRDGLNQLFVIGQGFSKMVNLRSYGPVLTDLDYDDFTSQILPLKNSSSLAYYFDDQIWDYPEFTHYAKEKTSGDVTPIRTIRDAFTMELFRAAYKYMPNRDKLKAIRLEYETGIDKEIYGAYMSGFQYSLYYQSIYAPMFCLDDTTAIFDHHNNYIFFHDLEGHAVDSVLLNYNDKAMGKFDKKLVQDPKSKDIYAVYKKNGRKYLRKILLENGQASHKISLYYPYPEKIKIVGNQVYYVYRKTEGRNTKHLYAEYLSD